MFRIVDGLVCSEWVAIEISSDSRLKVAQLITMQFNEVASILRCQRLIGDCGPLLLANMRFTFVQ